VKVLLVVCHFVLCFVCNIGLEARVTNFVGPLVRNVKESKVATIRILNLPECGRSSCCLAPRVLRRILLPRHDERQMPLDSPNS